MVITETVQSQQNYSIAQSSSFNLSLKQKVALQLVEIDEHKWYRSEQAGYDIQWEHATKDWVRTGHAERFHKAVEAHSAKIIELCQGYCQDGSCKGLLNCPVLLHKQDLHQALDDMTAVA